MLAVQNDEIRLVPNVPVKPSEYECLYEIGRTLSIDGFVRFSYSPDSRHRMKQTHAIKRVIHRLNSEEVMSGGIVIGNKKFVANKDPENTRGILITRIA